MHPTYEKFRATELGRELDELIAEPRRYEAYAALSRQGLPAVAALTADLKRRFGTLDNHVARRFVGAKVAEVMRGRGHEVIPHKRGRVPDRYFTYGAVFTPEPSCPAREATSRGSRRDGWAAFLDGPGVDFPERDQPKDQVRERF